jgi:hypothetical protein
MLRVVSRLLDRQNRMKEIPAVLQVEVKVLDEPWNWDRFMQQQIMHEKLEKKAGKKSMDKTAD